MQAPSEHSVDRAREHCVIDGLVGPSPKYAVGLMMCLQQRSRLYRWNSQAFRQAFRLHAVLHCEYALLEQLAFRPMRILGCPLRDSAGFSREAEVRVTGSVCG